jgi:hypothetical protein
MNDSPKFFKRITVEGCHVDIPFTDTVVSTRCERCGALISLDLEDLIHKGQIDLEANVCCHECTNGR